MIEVIKKGIKKVIFTFIKPPLEYVKNSYAQAGEDVIMQFLFYGKHIKHPSYLELGVYLPDSHNNTYLFYRNGSRGVCVEADETLIDNIKAVRKEDTVLNVGVGFSDDAYADFYIFNDAALNTFNKEEAEFRERHGTHKIEKVAKVQIKSINSILRENFPNYPHILSIDIEGLDLEVLKTLDFTSFPIPVICVETCIYSENHIKPKNTDIAHFMISKGYFMYADTYINTIFVKQDWFYETDAK